LINVESYPFKTRPYSHQYAVLDNTWNIPNFALHLEMGLGKTRITIDTLSLLWLNDKITHALVVAPSGVYQNWVSEFVKHCPDVVKHKVHVWKSLSTKAEQAAYREFINRDEGELKIFLVNTEALSTKKGYTACQIFLERVAGKSAMVIDESTAIKNPKARRTKAAIELGKYATYRRVLSGLPTPNSPLDIYSPFMFLSGAGEHLLGIDNYYAFRARYCEEKTMRLGSQRQFKVIAGFRRLDELNERISFHAARLRKDECLDLPEKIYTSRKCELTEEQKKLYKALKKDFLIQLEEDDSISASIVLTKMLRFMQIVTGHSGTDAGETISVPSKRIDCLMEILAETTGKVVIWSNFRQCIQDIEQAIAKEYGAASVCSFYGDTKREDRVDHVEKFQDPDSELRFFVGNPSAAGFGITLTEANTCVYFSRDFRLDSRLQSEDRLHRIGQNSAVTYIDLYSPDTIEEKVINALRSKVDLSAKVLGEKAQEWL
jgi:SNF2 family DNA or RNA helicase